MPPPKRVAASPNKVSIINAVTTPLGFFVLVVLVVEVIFGLSLPSASQAYSGWLIGSMVSMIFALIFIVALLAYYRPEALQGRRVDTPATAASNSPELPFLPKPMVLFLGTPDFESCDVERDEQILRELFGGAVTAVRRASSEDLRNRTTAKRFDIVHLAGFVDPKSGDFVFSPADRIRPEGLAELISVTDAKLVVLASCDSLILGTKLARSASMVAATKAMTVDDFCSWARCFYGCLASGRSLSKSYQVATESTDAPMILLMRHDLRFKV